MNSRFTEFALRKQRLQLRALEQRRPIIAGVRRVERALDVVDSVHDHARWVREKTPLFAGAAFLLAVAKPRVALRLARRLWLGWLVYRRLEPRFAPLVAAVGGFRARASRRGR